MKKPSGKDIILLGATGLVGGECLARLLNEPGFSRIVTLTRQALSPSGLQMAPGVVFENHVIDFDRLSESGSLFSVGTVICCLGTTIKKAGSESRFRQIDFELPLAASMLAREHGARHFLLVSSMGADPASRFFYNRVKGELEAALIHASFAHLTILRPSLLVGDRREFRIGEVIGKHLAFLTPRRYRPVLATSVAACLVAKARKPGRGLEILESEEIARFGS